MIVGGTVYNTTEPAPSNGQSMADPNGNLRPAPQCNNVINIERTATTEVHTFTGYGYVCSIVLIGATAQSLASTKEPDNLRDRRHGRSILRGQFGDADQRSQPGWERRDGRCDGYRRQLTEGALKCTSVTYDC